MELDQLMNTVVTHISIVQTRLIFFFLVTHDSVRPVALKIDVRLLHPAREISGLLLNMIRNIIFCSLLKMLQAAKLKSPRTRWCLGGRVQRQRHALGGEHAHKHLKCKSLAKVMCR